MIKICKQNNWEYIMVLKEERLPSVMEQYLELVCQEKDNIIFKEDEKEIKVYQWVNEIDNQKYKTNIVEEITYYKSSREQTKWIWITNREINEEVSINLGYAVDIKDFRYMYSFRKEQIFSENYIERQFYDFFILRKRGITINNIKFQENEVQDVKFVEISELAQMIENNELVERPEVYSELMNYLFRI